MKGNASVYQVNTVSRITGDGRAEFLRTCGGLILIKRVAGGGEGGKGTGVAGQFVRGNSYVCMLVQYQACPDCCVTPVNHFPLKNFSNTSRIKNRIVVCVLPSCLAAVGWDLILVAIKYTAVLLLFCRRTAPRGNLDRRISLRPEWSSLYYALYAPL